MLMRLRSPHIVTSDADQVAVLVFLTVKIKILARTTTEIDSEMIPIIKLAMIFTPHEIHPHIHIYKSFKEILKYRNLYIVVP